MAALSTPVTKNGENTFDAVTQIARIQEFAESLSAVQASELVCRIACQAARRVIGASGAVLMRPTLNGDLEPVGWDGYDEKRVARFMIPAGPPETPALRALASGQPVFIEDRATLEREFAQYVAKGSPQNNAWAVLPVRSRARTLGVISLAFARPRTFGPTERATLSIISDLCGQALDRTLLLESERLARAEAERKMEWEHFQAQAGDVIAMTLDETRIIEGVSRLAVPRLATWVDVDAVEGNTLRRVAIAHNDPVKQAEVWETFYRDPSNDPNSPIAVVARSRKPLVVAHISPNDLRRNARDLEHIRRMESMGIGTCMLVPILVGSQVLGIISFVRESPAYGDDDLVQATQLVQRAALAIANARLVADLSAASASKAQAMRIVAHDVRTPLAAALMRCQTALIKDPTSSAATLATGVKRSLERIERIMRQLLDATQLEAGGLDVKRHPVDLAEAAREAVATVAPIAAARDLTVVQDLAPAPTMGDADRLLQVAENLVSNAVKFTPPGGSIRLRTRVEGGYATLTVSDAGAGWRADQAQLLFRPFSRPNANETGTGLGLYLARGVVEALGGTLDAASRGPHLGATFTVRMPLLPAAQKEP